MEGQEGVRKEGPGDGVWRSAADCSGPGPTAVVFWDLGFFGAVAGRGQTDGGLDSGMDMLTTSLRARVCFFFSVLPFSPCCYFVVYYRSWSRTKVIVVVGRVTKS